MGGVEKRASIPQGVYDVDTYSFRKPRFALHPLTAFFAEIGENFIQLGEAVHDKNLSDLELHQFRNHPIYSGEGVPKGNGGKIVLIPGFGCTNSSLQELYQWLVKVGYDPSFALSGINLGHYSNYNEVKKALEGADVGIGHSAGGVLAKIAKEELREEGKNIPKKLIALGSPLDFPMIPENRLNSIVMNSVLFFKNLDKGAASMEQLVYKYLHKNSKPGELISVISKGDKIMRYTERKDAKIVELQEGSHHGLPHNVLFLEQLPGLLAS